MNQTNHGTRRPRLLFVCAHNSGRSPMAEGFARALGGDDLEVRSAGLQPRGRVDPLAIRSMSERGIDISRQRSRSLSADDASWADVRVLIAAEDEALGPLPRPGTWLRWVVEDPLGWPLEIYEDIRNEVEARVDALLVGLAPIPLAPQGGWRDSSERLVPPVPTI